MKKDAFLILAIVICFIVAYIIVDIVYLHFFNVEFDNTIVITFRLSVFDILQQIVKHFFLKKEE